MLIATPDAGGLEDVRYEVGIEIARSSRGILWTGRPGSPRSFVGARLLLRPESALARPAWFCHHAKGSSGAGILDHRVGLRPRRDRRRRGNPAARSPALRLKLVGNLS